jgi:hypothetical protein
MERMARANGPLTPFFLSRRQEKKKENRQNSWWFHFFYRTLQPYRLSTTYNRKPQETIQRRRVATVCLVADLTKYIYQPKY